MVVEFRTSNSTTPVILMGYLNSVLAMANFANRAKEAGVDGLIMVNLPQEEAAGLRQTLTAEGIDLVSLIAPTTADQRAKEIVAMASGFLYYVSLKGTTGSDAIAVDEVAERMSFLQTLTSVPICVGFGIKDGESAAAVSAHADGVVVGSALVQLMSDSPDPATASERLETATAEIRHGLDG